MECTKCCIAIIMRQQMIGLRREKIVDAWTHVGKVVRVIGGDPFWLEVAPPTPWQARRAGRESDRVVRPARPGNAGGGKDPDFWRAFEGAEDR
jgi:hypothetical protein